MKRIIGLMSGTSVDGVDAAVVDVRGSGTATQLKVVASDSIPYSRRTRDLILSYLNARGISVAEISQLNYLIGNLFADAVLKTCRRKKIRLSSIDLIGSHGQTIYHQSIPSRFSSRRLASTLQLGEAAVIAERTGVTTISDFRVRDVAAGGTGAPLVPYVDYLLLGSPRKNRIALNLGGIANLTYLPKNCRLKHLLAFDCGPGNMMMDAAIEIRTRGRMRFDRDGIAAANGKVNERILNKLLRHPFYQRRPPKAAGREEFGIDYTRFFLRQMRSIGLQDVLATFVELTARTIVEAVQRFVRMPDMIDELIVSGGGARNLFLMSRLRGLMPKTLVMSSSEVGLDPDAKEAIAFAVLANETWHSQPGNVPSVTGARHRVILGKITPA